MKTLLILFLAVQLTAVQAQQQPNQPKQEQCKAMTKKGKQCSRKAKKEGYCTQHYNLLKAKEAGK